MHRTFGRAPRILTLPDLHLLDGVVAPEILHAMRAASAQLSAAGIRHGLAGALAVGAHGYPRATKDVDFLVGDEAFEHHKGGIVSIAPGVPIRINQVAIDPISIIPSERHLDADLNRVEVTGGIPVLPVEALIYLKLTSPRKRDAADVVELIKCGIDEDAMRQYLRQNAPNLMDRFEDLVVAASAEED